MGGSKISSVPALAVKSEDSVGKLFPQHTLFVDATVLVKPLKSTLLTLVHFGFDRLKIGNASSGQKSGMTICLVEAMRTILCGLDVRTSAQCEQRLLVTPEMTM
jgi:hypothetical protein